MSNSLNKSTLMRLNFARMTDNSTRVTFKHQCYKLVPDIMSPEEGKSANFKENYKTSTPNEPRKRRQLPKIPEGMKPLGKLWKKEIERVSFDKCHPLSIDIKDQNDSNNDTVSSESLRWRRNLSTNMTLEIDTNPNTGHTISLRMLEIKNNKEVNNEDNETQRTTPDEAEYFEDDSINLTNGNCFRTNYNDSGVSSNLQSPTVSTSDSIDYSTKRKESTEIPEMTHRALHKFCARHSDEIDLEIGDSLHIFKEYDDQWSDGVNLRTAIRGIFPSSLVTDVDYSDFNIEAFNHLTETESISNERVKFSNANFRIKRERFVLDFLGSLEVSCAKGDQVIDEAINRIIQTNMPPELSMNIPYKCTLEVSDIGVRMMSDAQKTKVQHLITKYNSQNNNKNRKIVENCNPHYDYFFSLLQLTYCGYQSKKDKNFFAFITRHPSGQSRHACHVFQTPKSTQNIAETVGKAFRLFYNRFVEITVPFSESDLE